MPKQQCPRFLIIKNLYRSPITCWVLSVSSLQPLPGGSLVILFKLSNASQISGHFKVRSYIKRKIWVGYELLLPTKSLMVIDKFCSQNTVAMMLPWSLSLCCYWALRQSRKAGTESIPFRIYRVWPSRLFSPSGIPGFIAIQHSPSDSSLIAIT